MCFSMVTSWLQLTKQQDGFALPFAAPDVESWPVITSAADANKTREFSGKWRARHPSIGSGYPEQRRRPGLGLREQQAKQTLQDGLARLPVEPVASACVVAS